MNQGHAKQAIKKCHIQSFCKQIGEREFKGILLFLRFRFEQKINFIKIYY